MADASTFRRLHEVAGKPLILANAWDAGSARAIESCGAAAIATTSAGLAWSRGYPDGDALPPRILAVAVAEIARVLSVPLSVDVEGGYSHDPEAVADAVRAVVDAGGVGINIEDGAGSPDLLCAKIGAARKAAASAGVDLFINARTDVYLRELVPAERAVSETLARAARYRAAGCDGVFVPRLAGPDAIREVVNAVGLPVNLLVVPGLAPVGELAKLGVRRVSAGSAITQAAYGLTHLAATRLLKDGLYDGFGDRALNYGDLNALFASRS
jgi:2-methylisocitrate lyase-like PEP mutase family enzyme